MSLESDIDLLARIPLFSALADDHLRLLAFSAVRRRLSIGDVLFRFGDPADSGYIVELGSVELWMGAGDARRVVESCHRGYLIGELPLFVETKRRTNATATGPTSLLEITRPTMRRMLEEYPVVAALLHGKLAGRFGETIDDLKTVRDRLFAIPPPR